MASRMIWCPVCKRYVPLVQKGYRIYCPDCGREVLFSSKRKEKNAPAYSEKNISPPRHDSVSPKPIENTTTIEEVK